MRKEFFMLLLKEILDPKYGMFTHYQETRAIWFSELSLEEQGMYFLIGKFQLRKSQFTHMLIVMAFSRVALWFSHIQFHDHQFTFPTSPVQKVARRTSSFRRH